MRKKSLEPISSPKTRVLILGTMPSEESLKKQEYYAHPRNRFWKIIAGITHSEFPLSYTEKKSLLLKSDFAIWDVVEQAERKGSMDSNIKNEKPNDLNSFVIAHKQLKIIAFNGQKAEKLFDKYFDRKNGIEYISLPSSSPANAKFSLEELQNIWSGIV